MNAVKKKTKTKVAKKTTKKAPSSATARRKVTRSAADSGVDTAAIDIREYEWLRPLWRRLTDDVDSLHHSLLICGAAGLAKREFAIAFSQWLLCERARVDAPACGECRNCVLFAAATHPDFHVLTTERESSGGRIELIARYSDRYQDAAKREKRANPSSVIPIDEVRLLIDRFATHPHIAARKVAVLVPAERMNVNSANALLKLLEEPPSNAVLMLVTHAPQALPATILSRCMRIEAVAPSASDARDWLAKRAPKASDEDLQAALKLSGGAPLGALAAHHAELPPLYRAFLRETAALAAGNRGALDWSGEFAKHDLAQLLIWLHHLSCDLIRASTAGAPNPLAPTRAAHWSTDKAFELYDKIGALRKMVNEPFDRRLALDELALALRRVVAVR